MEREIGILESRQKKFDYVYLDQLMEEQVNDIRSAKEAQRENLENAKRVRAIQEQKEMEVKSKSFSFILNGILIFLDRPVDIRGLPEKDRLYIQKIKDLSLKHKELKDEEERLMEVCNRFVNNYFHTMEGIAFAKENDHEVFVKPEIDKEALEELETLGKEQQALDKLKQMEKGASSHNNWTTSNLQGSGQHSENQPGDIQLASSLNQPLASSGVSKNKSFRIKSSGRARRKNKISITTINERKRQQDKKDKTESDMRYHFSKNKQFNLYGKPRKRLPAVRCLFQSDVISEPNQDFIRVEAPVDKRVRTSSLANRMYIPAFGVEQIRKDADHIKLMTMKDRGFDDKTLTEKRTLMSISALKDKLQKDLIVFPANINFGNLEADSRYETHLLIKNEDALQQRIRLVQPQNSLFKVVETKKGPISMGLDKKIKIVFQPGEDADGYFEDYFKIVSKYRVYTIPIKASIGDKGKKVHDIMMKSQLTGQSFRRVESNNKLRYPIIRRSNDSSSQRNIGIQGAGLTKTSRKNYSRDPLTSR